MDGLIAMLPKPIQALSTHHDFHGQKIAERIYQVVMTIAGFIGFIIGYKNQQLSHAIFFVIGAAVLTALIILPPWPFLFRKHPIVWLTPKAAQQESKKSK
ncbi:unnamed protein product [Caenorhabditis bovis]|uniref:Signal peptidase complex subunit 1 n=1 Tax=Caenorhabditis bovis TaxID=2654633 RepID=A0A8S1F9L2_9PELO|nr:unnamed protein product [Caenorhabditis bovis]